ncbi:hypothetical protein [Helicobacter sp.]|nr:hypothetical protein [Helicobacter sp.]
MRDYGLLPLKPRNDAVGSVNCEAFVKGCGNLNEAYFRFCNGIF